MARGRAAVLLGRRPSRRRDVLASRAFAALPYGEFRRRAGPVTACCGVGALLLPDFQRRSRGLAFLRPAPRTRIRRASSRLLRSAGDLAHAPRPASPATCASPSSRSARGMQPRAAPARRRDAKSTAAAICAASSPGADVGSASSSGGSPSWAWARLDVVVLSHPHPDTRADCSRCSTSCPRRAVAHGESGPGTSAICSGPKRRSATFRCVTPLVGTVHLGELDVEVLRSRWFPTRSTNDQFDRAALVHGRVRPAPGRRRGSARGGGAGAVRQRPALRRAKAGITQAGPARPKRFSARSVPGTSSSPSGRTTHSDFPTSKSTTSALSGATWRTDRGAVTAKSATASSSRSGRPFLIGVAATMRSVVERMVANRSRRGNRRPSVANTPALRRLTWYCRKRYRLSATCSPRRGRGAGIPCERGEGKASSAVIPRSTSLGSFSVPSRCTRAACLTTRTDSIPCARP